VSYPRYIREIFGDTIFFFKTSSLSNQWNSFKSFKTSSSTLKVYKELNYIESSLNVQQKINKTLKTN
jgi:hypothetical protein